MNATEGIFQIKVQPNDNVNKITAKLRACMEHFSWDKINHATVHLYRKELSEQQTQNVMDACGRLMGRYTMKPHTKKAMLTGYAVVHVEPEAVE